jgi:hypothetical protein
MWRYGLELKGPLLSLPVLHDSGIDFGKSMRWILYMENAQLA